MKKKVHRDGTRDPRYRNPASPYEVWRGRGRLPRWLKELIAGGARLSDFLVSDVEANRKASADRIKDWLARAGYTKNQIWPPRKSH